MAGSPLSAFGMFVASTGPTIYTSQEAIINDAQRTNYNTLGYLLRGQRMSDVLSSGAYIQDHVYLSSQSVTHSYQPGATETYTQPQVGTQWRVDWRFFLTYIAWTDQELELQAGSGMTTKARYMKYKDVWFQKEQNNHTDRMNYCEDVAWAVPDKTKMESQDGQEFYSIPCFVNEFPNGLPSAAHPGGVWTTVQGIDPTAAGKENWKPQTFDYDNVAAATPATNLIAALDSANLSLDFRPPPMYRESFEQRQGWASDLVCFTSKKGVNNARRLYRDSNDRWQDNWDPFGNPMYGGMPFVYVAKLDSAAIFPTGASAALSTELDTAGTTNAGPRYFLIRPKYLRMVFHSDRYFKNLGEMTDMRQPTVHAMPIDTWGNMICRSRIRHGIIKPTADIA